jgi:hypothetical protein
MARRRRKAEQVSQSERQCLGSSWSATRQDITRLLVNSLIRECRPILWGSNGTFLVRLSAADDAGESRAVYKPRRGEAPLWDFPRGTLYRREMATYLVSEALGWMLVPPTVVRDGPYGIGSVQLFIEHDPEQCFISPADRDREAAEQIALLDVLLNNADRKCEHCIQGLDGHLWAIDHGLTFHTDPKLRTVIWDFAGAAIASDLLADLRRLVPALQAGSPLRRALAPLVSDSEVDAVLRRLRLLVRGGTHPDPGLERRRIPWGWGW